MSMSKIALAIPLVLGIACSHSRTQSKDHTGAMWTEQGGGSSPSDAQPQGSDQTGGSTSSTGAGSASSASSDSSGAAGTDGAALALTAGSSDTGAPGSGGSSESMGPANPSGSSGTEQGSSATGSPGQGTGTGTAMDATSGEMVKGKVTKVSSSEISITPKGGTAKTLKIGDDTHVMINGKEAKPSQLKAGQWVQAAYDTDMMATKIVVSSSKQGHKGSSSSHHGTSGSSGSGSSGSSGSSGTGGSSGGTQ